MKRLTPALIDYNYSKRRMLNLFTMQWPHAHITFHVTRTTRYGKEWLKIIIQTTHPSVWLLPSQTHVTYDKLYKMPGITWVDTAMFEAVYDVILVYPNNVEIILYCIFNTCLKIVLQFKSLTKIYYLTIISRARMGSESIAHDAEGRMGYWVRGHEGERNNCLSKIQLVGQKYRE